MHQRLRCWCESDVIERIFRYLATDHDNEYISTAQLSGRVSIVPELSKKNTDQAIGRSRGELTTKIHVICDAVGHPVELGITPEQDADITKAETPLENIDLCAFLADKAYNTDSLTDRLIQRGITPVIPPKRNRTTRRSFINFPSLKTR